MMVFMTEVHRSSSTIANSAVVSSSGAPRFASCSKNVNGLTFAYWFFCFLWVVDGGNLPSRIGTQSDTLARLARRDAVFETSVSTVLDNVPLVSILWLRS